MTLGHPDMPDPSVLSRIARRLKESYGAERVIVFGSVARGTATIHSDIDLLVVAAVGDKAYRRMAAVKAAVRDLSRGLSISAIVFTPRELRERLADEDPFVKDILASGVEL